jgi:murein DD-endopeptidase MepM/ murein hydrolase activator NlpD
MKNKSSIFAKVILYGFAMMCLSNFIYAQNLIREGTLLPYENEPTFSAGPCVTESEKTEIKARIEQSKQRLISKGLLDPAKTAVFGTHAFRWPLAPAKHVHRQGYYYISNYVDLDPASSGLRGNDPNHTLEDYNCGTRTYDVTSGYDHTGIDIGIGPFPWTAMLNEDVDVVAAEGGYISDKLDGEFDRTCKTGTPNVFHGNYVAITHSDGSSTFYMHMKSGTVTSKKIDDYVSAGEYLGKVGSSGNSTGPHLHFEVEDNFGSRRDPFQNGSCPTGANASLWANEEPYYNKQIVSIFTLSLPWTDDTCDTLVSPAQATIGTVPYCNHFNAGDAIWFSVALRDIVATNAINIKVFSPSGTQIYNYTYTEASSYRALRTISPSFILAPNVAGNYKIQCTYNGITRAHYFTVSCPGSVNLAGVRSSNYGYISGGTINSIDAINASARNVQYQAENYIQLNPGFIATNGCEFTAFIDNCTTGSTKQSDFSNTFNQDLDFSLIPNPVNDEFTISSSQIIEGVSYDVLILNAVGGEVLSLKNQGVLADTKIKTSNLPNGIYLVQVSTINPEGIINTSAKKLIVAH